MIDNINPNWNLGNYLPTIQSATNWLAQGIKQNPKNWVTSKSASDMLNSIIQPPNTSNLPNLDSIKNYTSNLSKPGDWLRKTDGKIAGVSDWISDKTGINLPTTLGGVSNLAADVVGMGLEAFGAKKADWTDPASDILEGASKIAQFVPGVGTAVSAGLKGLNLANRYLGKSSKKQMDSGIDTTGRMYVTSNNAGKKDTLIGTLFGNKIKKTNQITDLAHSQNLLASLSSYNQSQNQMVANNMQSTFNKNRNQLLGISDNIYANKSILAKDGIKIRKLAKEVTQTRKFEKGGKVNVIPDGALHARKNNLPENIAEHVTHKGIPVITKEGGEITQHAEIEKNEIIFHKELTNKLESLLKQYNESDSKREKDKIALEAGKLLKKEILYNTEDNTGLMENIK